MEELAFLKVEKGLSQKLCTSIGASSTPSPFKKNKINKTKIENSRKKKQTSCAELKHPPSSSSSSSSLLCFFFFFSFFFFRLESCLMMIPTMMTTMMILMMMTTMVMITMINVKNIYIFLYIYIYIFFLFSPSFEKKKRRKEKSAPPLSLERIKNFELGKKGDVKGKKARGISQRQRVLKKVYSKQ